MNKRLLLLGLVVFTIGAWSFAGCQSERASVVLVNLANLKQLRQEILLFERERGRLPKNIYELPGYSADKSGGAYQYKCGDGMYCDWVYLVPAVNDIMIVSPHVEKDRAGLRVRVLIYMNGHAEVIDEAIFRKRVGEP